MAHILLVDDNQTFLYASRELVLRHRPTFIVDTAFDAETALTAIRTHDYGAYAFLHKPVNPDAFFSVVNRAVLRSQMRRKPEQVLGDDSVWYPQAVEQARRKSNAIAERLRQTIQNTEPPWNETP